jgi:hypothetical protein
MCVLGKSDFVQAGFAQSLHRIPNWQTPLANLRTLAHFLIWQVALAKMENPDIL